MSISEPTWFNGDEPDPYPEGRYEQPDLLTCDRCAADAFQPVTTPLGVFCSHHCADADEAEFAERMARRGFQQVQPDLLTARED